MNVESALNLKHADWKKTGQRPDTLLKEARKIANQEQTTIKALIEEGLRLTIESRKHKGKFRL